MEPPSLPEWVMSGGSGKSVSEPIYRRSRTHLSDIEEPVKVPLCPGDIFENS